MIREQDDTEVIRRAEEAQRLLENRLLWELIGNLEAEQVSNWSGTAPSEGEDREHCWHRLKAIQDIRDALQNELDALAKAKRRAGRS